MLHSSYCQYSCIDFFSFFFFFNDTATTEIYTLSLHDALPISEAHREPRHVQQVRRSAHRYRRIRAGQRPRRSEEHTSELQSPCNLVCRLLLEKKKNRENAPASYGGFHRGKFPHTEFC